MLGYCLATHLQPLIGLSRVSIVWFASSSMKLCHVALVHCCCVAVGIETLGGKYELHDLVQLDANTAGVIIAIEKEVARVLTNNSTPTQPDVRICRVGFASCPWLVGYEWCTARLPVQKPAALHHGLGDGPSHVAMQALAAAYLLLAVQGLYSWVGAL